MDTKVTKEHTIFQGSDGKEKICKATHKRELQ
jgi:hypothetical protein